MKVSHLLSAFSTLVMSCSALEPVTIKNNTFWVGDTDERFYIRGADYQPGGSSNLTDALADADICARDIPYFQKLGLNAIRVYSVDNTQDHSECMQKLEDAGIYVILDVNLPKASISRWEIECSYNLEYLTEVLPQSTVLRTTIILLVSLPQMNWLTMKNLSSMLLTLRLLQEI